MARELLPMLSNVKINKANWARLLPHFYRYKKYIVTSSANNNVKETPKRNINPVLCHPILHVDRIVEVLLKSYVAVLNIQDLDMKIIFSRLTMQSILADTRPKGFI